MPRPLGAPRTLQDYLEVTDLHIKVSGLDYTVVATRDLVTRDGAGVEFARNGGDRVRVGNANLTNQVRNSVERIVADIDSRDS